jgi:hypothetical protein
MTSRQQHSIVWQQKHEQSMQQGQAQASNTCSDCSFRLFEML